MSNINYDYHNPDPQAVRAFDTLWRSNRPWILNYLGKSGTGKSQFLSWLIENRCQVADEIPYSLVSFRTYTSDIDTLLSSMAASIISTAPFSREQATRVAQKLTGKETAHWIGVDDSMPLILFFDDYETFQAESTKEQRSIFLDSINHAHMRLPGLRVVIASSDYCLMPDVWFYMREYVDFEQRDAYFR